MQKNFLNKTTPIALYGLTPPKMGTAPEKVSETAQKQINRLKDLELDALVMYDIQDEKSRTNEERPFPFLETLDPQRYCNDYLSDLGIPKIIYRAVGKYDAQSLTNSLYKMQNNNNGTVFVGAASKYQKTPFTMQDAYNTYKKSETSVPLGGVVIPERHMSKKDEHLRVENKINSGCSYFISQGVYNSEASKNFLSDYYYHCSEKGIEMAPIVFTFTPCGSMKTLQFMKWLGISIPHWLEQDLKHSQDILEMSIDICEQNWIDLYEYAKAKKIPIGYNIESVAIRKVEIEASMELLKKIQTYNASN